MRDLQSIWIPPRQLSFLEFCAVARGSLGEIRGAARGYLGDGLSACLIAVLVAAAQDSRIAAVLELKNKLQGPERDVIDASFLTDQVRAGVLEAIPSFKVMTRDNLL